MGNVQEVQEELLEELRQSAMLLWNQSLNDYDKTSALADAEARDAAKDHHQRISAVVKEFREACSSDFPLMERLEHHREHARFWAQKDNKSAKLHAEMLQHYQRAQDEIAKLDHRRTEHPPVMELNCLYHCTGGSKGTIVQRVTYLEGFVASKDLTILQQKKFWLAAKTSLSAPVCGAEVGASSGVGTSWQKDVRRNATFKNSKATEVVEELTIDLSKPLYVYQVETTVQEADVCAIFHGTRFTTSYPINSVEDAVWQASNGVVLKEVMIMIFVGVACCYLFHHWAHTMIMPLIMVVMYVVFK